MVYADYKAPEHVEVVVAGVAYPATAGTMSYLAGNAMLLALGDPAKAQALDYSSALPKT